MTAKKAKRDDTKKGYQLRISDDEKKALEKAAEKAGLPTTTWMRLVCLKVAKGDVAVSLG